MRGCVWATDVVAFGINTTFSQAKVENDQRTSGWRAELSYSKTFETGTNLVLAAYRYSTRGFRDLEDVLGMRRQQQAGISYYSDSLNQRNRLSTTLSQSMDEYGLVSLSASTADYYNNQSRITQLQLGYKNNILLFESHYVEKIFNKFNQNDCVPVSMSLDPKISYVKNEGIQFLN